MAGLLDFFASSQDDPRYSMNLAFFKGLANRDVAGGLLAGQQMQDQRQDRVLKRGLLEAQIAETLAQGEERKSKLAAMRNQQDMLNRILGGNRPSQPAAPGQLGSGSFGAVAPPAGQPDILPVQRGGRLAGMSLDDVALLKANGIDLVEPWKAANIPTQIRANSYSMLPGQQPKYMPDPTKGMSFDNGRISALPGYGDFLSGQTFAQEFPKTILGAAGQVNLRENPDGTQRPVVSLEENPILRGMAGQFGMTLPGPAPTAPAAPPASVFPPSSQRIAPEEQKARDAESIRVIQSEIDKEQNPETKAALQRELGRMTASQSQPGFPTPTLKITPGQGYGKTTAQKQEDQSRGAYMDVVAKDMAETRNKLLAGGLAAPGNIAKYQRLGQLLADVDGGSLTPAGTQIASMMNSFGFKIDKNLQNKEAAMALANQIALEMRNPAGGAGMPGALSDKDREFLVGMTPNQGQSAEGRKILIQSYVALQQRNQQVATFARNYEKKYGQLDNGFFEQLQAWSNANQMFGAK